MCRKLVIEKLVKEIISQEKKL